MGKLRGLDGSFHLMVSSASVLNIASPRHRRLYQRFIEVKRGLTIFFCCYTGGRSDAGGIMAVPSDASCGQGDHYMIEWLFGENSHDSGSSEASET